MSSRSVKESKKTSKNLEVTSRCVAVIFKRCENLKSSCDDSRHGPATDREANELDRNFFSLGNDADYRKDGNKKSDKVTFDPKKVFEEFKLRNKTCYWNPALVDSVNSLEYVGFIEPLTVLVKGDDIHLENIRTAWGRRVLKDPANFTIERIGNKNKYQLNKIK